MSIQYFENEADNLKAAYERQHARWSTVIREEEEDSGNALIEYTIMRAVEAAWHTALGRVLVEREKADVRRSIRSGNYRN